MARSPCIDSPFIELAGTDRQQLLDIARASIKHGLTAHQPLQLKTYSLSDPLKEAKGSFVTISQSGRLRGCMGSLEAKLPLAQAVADNAFNAAFKDTRFPRMRPVELEMTHIEVAILSIPELITSATEAELIAALNPYKDGLVLEDNGYRSTFLPKVWEKLPDSQDFIRELKIKAGLPADYWSATLRFYRYGTLAFEDQPVKNSKSN